MADLRNSTNRTAAPTAIGTMMGSEKETKANAQTNKGSSKATVMGAHAATAADRTLLERAERVAAEFDTPTEQLDACIVEFVREMGVCSITMILLRLLPFFFSAFV